MLNQKTEGGFSRANQKVMFHWRATLKVAECTFILCRNGSKSSWKCLSVPLKKQNTHPNSALKQVLSLQVKGKETCVFSCGYSEGRKVIPGIDFTTLNLCHDNHPPLIKKGNFKSVSSCLLKKNPFGIISNPSFLV